MTLLSPPTDRMKLPVVSFAARVFTRGPAAAVRNWRKRVLRSEYRRGNARAARDTHEEIDPLIVETGAELRRNLLACNANKHAAAGYRVLMLRPASITAEIWFGDLQRCMQYAGIECRVLPPDTPPSDIAAAFEEFHPNVFISTESVQSLRLLDLHAIARHKRRHGCLRHFVPVWHADAPRDNVPSGRTTPAEDAWRRRLRRNGLLADAHFSIFEPEFHERFSRDRASPAVEYVVIPQGCNPFSDYPVVATKRFDYLMVTSMTDERVEVSYRFLRPIIRDYRGLWAGASWGFGADQGIAPAQMPLHYAQSRIALSPLVGFVFHYAAELTHRVYAAAACGTFQITMPTPITHRYFTRDELVQAASPEEYARLFAHYVGRPAERNAIALAAMRRAYSEHTCFHRVDKLVSHWNEWRRRGLF